MLSQISYIKIKAFLINMLELQNDFCENLTEFYQISLNFGLSLRFQSTSYDMYGFV